MMGVANQTAQAFRHELSTVIVFSANPATGLTALYNFYQDEGLPLQASRHCWDPVACVVAACDAGAAPGTTLHCSVQGARPLSNAWPSWPRPYAGVPRVWVGLRAARR